MSSTILDTIKEVEAATAARIIEATEIAEVTVRTAQADATTRIEETKRLLEEDTQKTIESFEQEMQQKYAKTETEAANLIDGLVKTFSAKKPDIKKMILEAITVSK